LFSNQIYSQGEGAAERAIRELNGREFRGRNLVVEESRGRPLHSTKVFVGNLSGMCTTEDLQELFQTFGKVLECDKVKGEPRPFSLRGTPREGSIPTRVSQGDLGYAMNTFPLHTCM
jgi:RNA recognition motif-containing protein